MGKKKSVVLMVLLTIVIVALCALVAFPKFPIPGSPNSWNPVALQYDLDADLGGGYYVNYYPEGVIPASEYDEQLAALTVERDEIKAEAVAEAEAKGEATTEDALANFLEGHDEYQEAEEKLNEFKESYKSYKGLYLSTDDDLAIWEDVETGAVSKEFQDNFAKAVALFSSRLEAKEYSSVRLAVVDDYALRLEIPTSDLNASIVMSTLMLTEELTLSVGDELVDELKAEDAKASDLIKEITIGTRYKTAYLKVKFTSEGKDMIKRVKSTLSNANGATDTSSLTGMDIKIGDQVIATIYQDSIMDNNREARVFAVDQVNKVYLETFEILLNSALTDGSAGISFRALSNNDIRAFESVYGENVLTLLYIALAIVLVALLILPVLKMGRFGVVGGYANLSYFVITTICFAFITKGIFEVSLGTVLVFLVGLAIMNAMHFHVYNAIKKEFNNGKTIESCVKGGYNKTLWNVVDVYAVAILGAIAMILGVANLYTVALQALICLISAAFCSLLWARAINFVFLSASYNKYKYFHFVREDDEDDE